MRSYIAGFNRSTSKLFVFILLFVALLGVGGISSRALRDWQKGELPEVRNETESFQLVKITRQDDDYLLHMKNTSTKAITAYMVGDENGPSMTRISYFRDYVVAPGEIEEVWVGSKEMPASGADTPRRQIVTILCVMFDDHSSEGDFDADRQIRDLYLGEKIQLERINRLLHQAMQSPDANHPAAIERLMSQISSLPEEQEAGQSLWVHFGLHDAKEIIISNLSDELSQWQEGMRIFQSNPEKLGRVMEIHQRIDNILTHSQRWAARL